MHIGFMNLGPIIAYVVLAILLPSAATPEDRLKMKGKAVNPQTLANEVSNEAQQKMDAAVDADYHRNNVNAKGCVSGFFSILVAMFQLLLIIACSLAFVVILFMLIRLYIVPQPSSASISVRSKWRWCSIPRCSGCSVSALWWHVSFPPIVRFMP